MKVLSYLELGKLKLTDNGEWRDYIDILAKIFPDTELESIGNYLYRFYSQPFKPELITELLEGWVIEYYDGINWYQYPKVAGCSFRWENNTLSGYRYFSNIRTLDDFITDCQRAGITLEWKIERKLDGTK